MSDGKSQKKRPYTKPELIEYGPVAKLTAGKSGPIKDGKSGMIMEQGGGTK